MFFLIIAGGMLAWGLTFLREYLVAHPMAFVVYWVACFGFTGLSFLTAALDMLIVRQRTREEKQKLMVQSFQEAAPGSDDAVQGEAKTQRR